MRALWITCCAALALAACAKPHPATNNVSITIPGGSGGGSIVIGNQTPTNLPGYAKIYPGATVTATTTTPGGGILAMETNDTPDKVAAFYKQDAQDAGLTSQMDTAAMSGGSQNNHMMTFGSPGGNKSLTVTVTVETQGGPTKVGLIYGGL